MTAIANRTSAVVLAGLLAAGAAAACSRGADGPGADRRGAIDARAVMADAGCGSCHEIPGVEGADGRAAPPLTHFARRAWVAGRLENEPVELARWIEDPLEVDPKTAMPDLDLTDDEARAVADYLLTIE